MVYTFIALIVTITGGIIGYLEKSSDNKNEAKSNHFNYWGLIVLLIGAIIAFGVNYQGNVDKEFAEKQKEIADQKIDSINKVIISKQDELRILNDTVQYLQFKIIDLQLDQRDSTKRLIANQYLLSRQQAASFYASQSILEKSIDQLALQQQINDKQLEVMKEITGDGNIPKLFINGYKVTPEDTTFFIYANLMNESKYPITDARVSVTEWFQKEPYRDATLRQFDVSVGDINPYGDKQIFNSKVPFLKWSNDYHYIINVMWRHGQFTCIVDFPYDPSKKSTELYPKIDVQNNHGQLSPTSYIYLPTFKSEE